MFDDIISVSSNHISNINFNNNLFYCTNFLPIAA